MPQQPPVPARSLPYPLYVGWSHPTRIGMLPGPRELRGLVRVEMHVQTVFLNVGRSSRKIAVWVRVGFLNHHTPPYSCECVTNSTSYMKRPLECVSFHLDEMTHRGRRWYNDGDPVPNIVPSSPARYPRSVMSAGVDSSPIF